jgi:glycosyltransferase involved in cell wall biosynthesis
MRILFVSSFLLFAKSRSGAAKRLFYLARSLATNHAVSLICLDAGNEADSFEPASAPGSRLLQVKYSRGLGERFRNPFEVPNYLARESAREIDAFVTAEPPDIVLCAFGFALSLLRLPSLRPAPCVAYLEDDLSFEVFKERARKATSLARKVHMWIRWAQAEMFYQKLLRRAQLFVAISREEAAIIERKFPWMRTALVGYGIPLEEFEFIESRPAALTLGFIGNYIHQSNSDAMAFFLSDWFPRLRERFPEIRMHIAGKGIPPTLKTRWPDAPGVVWQEDVADLRDFYSAISVFVNPIVSQRGLRTKLVEAAAFGRPIISTPLGAEGLAHLGALLATSPEECVEACAALSEPQKYDDAARRGRAAVERFYSIEAIAGELQASLEALHRSQ